jgi:hypothetical protein
MVLERSVWSNHGKGESFLLVLLVVSSDHGGGMAFLTGEYGNGLTGGMA